jgi:tetratricopeptide (TPR) repeat protein
MSEDPRSSAVAAVTRARQLVSLRRWDAALDALGPAYGQDGVAADALRLRAQCLIGLGKPVEAVSVTRQSLALEPDSAWGHRLLALGELRSSRPRAALTAAREAVRLEPGSVHGHHLLAIAHLNRKQLPEARNVALVCLAQQPDAPLAHYTAAKVAEKERRNADAERHYRDGLRLSPSDSDLALGLAQFLHRNGRAAEAGQAYLAAGRNNPTDQRVRRGMARLGLPAAGAVGLGIKLVPLVAAGSLFNSVERGSASGRTPAVGAPVILLMVAVISAVVLGVVATIRMAKLRRGTSSLPEEVRRQLGGDRRNLALGWLRQGAFAWALLGVLALAVAPFSSASTPPTAGVVIGAAMLAVAAVGFGLVRWLWVGPRPGWKAYRDRLGHLGRRLADLTHHAR